MYLSAETRLTSTEAIRVRTPLGDALGDHVTVRLARPRTDPGPSREPARLVVSLTGRVVRKDGSIGQRSSTGKAAWDDLPEPARAALLSALRLQAVQAREDLDAFDAFLASQPHSPFEPPARPVRVGDVVGPPREEKCDAIGTGAPRFVHGFCTNRAVARVYCIDGVVRDVCWDDARAIAPDDETAADS